MAMLGMTNYSKVPLRLATLVGFGFAMISLLVAIVYFVYKILFWNSFSVGLGTLVRRNLLLLFGAVVFPGYSRRICRFYSHLCPEEVSGCGT